MSVTLPVKPRPNSMQPSLLDLGFIQRGASSLRVDRPGSRWRMAFTFPPMTVDAARSFISKLLRAKRQGLQIDIPLLVKQGIPGSPVVDGAGQAGTTIAVRGLTPGYIVKEQYWLTITEADGQPYLHSVAETVVADGLGNVTIEIEPPLRAPFADGDTVYLAKPFMLGFMDGEAYTWDVRSDRFIELTAMVEEFR